MNPVEEAKPYLQELILAGFHVVLRSDMPVGERKQHIAYVKRHKGARFRAFLSWRDSVWCAGIPKLLDIKEEPEPVSAALQGVKNLIAAGPFMSDGRPVMLWLEYGSAEAAINRINKWLRTDPK